MKRAAVIFLGIWHAFFLGGCLDAGKKEGSSSEEVSSNELVGTWQSVCYLDQGVKIFDSATFTDTTLTSTSTHYESSSSCNDTSKERAFRVNANYQIGSESSYVSGSKHFNSQPTKVEMIGYTVDAVAEMNDNSWCDKTDWVVDQWADVTNTSCDSDNYQIYKVEDGNKLYEGVIAADDATTCSGDPCDGTSDLRRPRVLESSYLMKQ